MPLAIVPGVPYESLTGAVTSALARAPPETQRPSRAAGRADIRNTPARIVWDARSQSIVT